MGKKRIVRVFMHEDNRFPSSKPLDFYTDDDTIQVGDAVVVDTRVGIFFAEVIDFPVSSEWANKWVICKIDLDAHNAKVSRYERKGAIESRLDRILDEHNRKELLRCLCEDKEEAAGLMKELESLENEV